IERGTSDPEELPAEPLENGLAVSVILPTFRGGGRVSLAFDGKLGPLGGLDNHVDAKPTHSVLAERVVTPRKHLAEHIALEHRLASLLEVNECLRCSAGRLAVPDQACAHVVWVQLFSENRVDADELVPCARGRHVDALAVLLLSKCPYRR